MADDIKKDRTGITEHQAMRYIQKEITPSSCSINSRASRSFINPWMRQPVYDEPNKGALEEMLQHLQKEAVGGNRNDMNDHGTISELTLQLPSLDWLFRRWPLVPILRQWMTPSSERPKRHRLQIPFSGNIRWHGLSCPRSSVMKPRRMRLRSSVDSDRQ